MAEHGINMSPWAFWLYIVLLIGSGAAADVPFVFDETASGVSDYNSDHLIKLSASSPDLEGVPFTSAPQVNETLEFPVAGGTSAPAGKAAMKVEELNKTINAQVEPNNSRVRDLALKLAARHSGDHTIDQVCEIYKYLKYGEEKIGGWSYVPDTRGIDSFNNASKSLTAGDPEKCAGAGDCDDFAILMASLVESIGGTTRIILARNNSTGGHAYTEVYLGRLDSENSYIQDIIVWLKQNYDTDKIYTHIDTDTRDVWLNLDWGPDEKGNAHAGGPFFKGDKHYIIIIRNSFGKTPLRVPEKRNKTPKIISLAPDRTAPQETGTSITWTAEAIDPENDPILYRFFLNDDPETKWLTDSQWTWKATDYDIGENQIEVRVRDGKHSGADGFDDHEVVSFDISKSKPRAEENQPPIIDSLVPDKASPQEAGATITWTANASDPEDDEIFYRFFLDDIPMTGWTRDRIWIWTAESNDSMNFDIESEFTTRYTIDVRVRDGMHASSDGFDDNRIEFMNIVAKSISRSEPTIDAKAQNKPPTLHNLKADKKEKDTGLGKVAEITWTATALDPDNDPVFYRFLLVGPSTDNAWKVMREWSINNQWVWSTIPGKSGTYLLYVYVIDGNHAPTNGGYDSSIGQEFILEGDRFSLISSNI